MEIFNKDQLELLAKLADYLETKVDNVNFDLENFRSTCGTVGCAFGYVPKLVAEGYVDNQVIKDIVEIHKMPESIYPDDWYRLMRDLFGGEIAEVRFRTEEDKILDYMFSSSWGKITFESTKEGTIKRIREVVKHNKLTTSIDMKMSDYTI